MEDIWCSVCRNPTCDGYCWKQAKWPRSNYLLKSPSGKYAYDMIDGPSDKWFLAIVTDYKDCQSYGEVIVGFEEDAPPSKELIEAIFTYLESKNNA